MVKYAKMFTFMGDISDTMRTILGVLHPINGIADVHERNTPFRYTIGKSIESSKKSVYKIGDLF